MAETPEIVIIIIIILISLLYLWIVKTNRHKPFDSRRESFGISAELQIVVIQPKRGELLLRLKMAFSFRDIQSSKDEAHSELQEQNPMMISMMAPNREVVSNELLSWKD